MTFEEAYFDELEKIAFGIGKLIDTVMPKDFAPTANKKLRRGAAAVITGLRSGKMPRTDTAEAAKTTRIAKDIMTAPYPSREIEKGVTSGVSAIKRKLGVKSTPSAGTRLLKQTMGNYARGVGASAVTGGTGPYKAVKKGVGVLQQGADMLKKNYGGRILPAMTGQLGK